MNSNHLKITAAVAMLIDHIGYVLVDIGLIGTDSAAFLIMCAIGRMAFPLFCFMLAEGVEKTADRERYISRMLVFAILSQIPFSVLFRPGGEVTVDVSLMNVCAYAIGAFILCLCLDTKRIETYVVAIIAAIMACIKIRVEPFTMLWPDMNTIYTLALAFLVILCLRIIPSKEITFNHVLHCFVPVLLTAAFIFSRAIGYDYGWFGIFLPAAIWLCRKSKYAQAAVIAVWSIAKYFNYSQAFIVGASVAAILILFYNGERGKDILPRKFFYWFYPVHLTVLAVFKQALRFLR